MSQVCWHSCFLIFTAVRRLSTIMCYCSQQSWRRSFLSGLDMNPIHAILFFFSVWQLAHPMSPTFLFLSAFFSSPVPQLHTFSHQIIELYLGVVICLKVSAVKYLKLRWKGCNALNLCTVELWCKSVCCTIVKHTCKLLYPLYIPLCSVFVDGVSHLQWHSSISLMVILEHVCHVKA